MNRRATRLMVGVVLGLATVGTWIVVTQSRPARMAADFTIDYAAGVLIRGGQFAAPYQQASLAETIHRVAPESRIDPRLPFNKPLAAALPQALLSLLPVDLAFRVWQAIELLALIGSLALLQRRYPVGRHWAPWAALGAASAVPVWATLTEGQPTLLVLLGAVLVLWAATERAAGWRPALLAAAGGALIAVKPQYLPAYLLVLFAARRPLASVSAIMGATTMLLSPLLAGPPGFAAMVHNALLANQVVSIRADESWVGLLGAVAPAAIASVVGLGLYVIVLLGLGWLAWRGRFEGAIYATLTGILAVLSSPHALPHDLVILAVPVWLSLSLWRRAVLANPLLAWTLVDLALVVDLRGIGVPVGAIALTGALAWGVRDARRRLATDAHRPPLSLAG